MNFIFFNHIFLFGQSFISNWVGRIFSTQPIKMIHVIRICEMYIFFNSRNKDGINNIKNLCTSHLLLKKGIHIIFID
jgi:hypothetical protein